MASDPTYKYVKGVGWVPEPEQPTSRILEQVKVTVPRNYHQLAGRVNRLDQFEVRICEEAVEYRRDREYGITLVGRPRRGPNMDMMVYYRLGRNPRHEELQYARQQVAREILRLENVGTIQQVTVTGTVEV